MNTTQPSTIVGIVLVALILLGMAGSAVGKAAADCRDRIEARQNAVYSQMFGN